ncbi:hypothetical protein D9M68_916740 [compost metagenome]
MLQLDKIKRLEAEVASMKLQVKSYQQTLASARDAAIQLAEVASQGDFFQSAESTPARLKHLVHGDSKVAAHLERLQGKS